MMIVRYFSPKYSGEGNPNCRALCERQVIALLQFFR